MALFACPSDFGLVENEWQSTTWARLRGNYVVNFGNTNYGLFPPPPTRIRDRQERQRRIGQRALEDFAAWMQRSGLS